MFTSDKLSAAFFQCHVRSARLDMILQIGCSCEPLQASLHTNSVCLGEHVSEADTMG